MITKRNTSIRPMQNKHDIKDKKEETTRYVYGDIGSWGIDHLEWITDFNKIKADVIHVRVDSGGGDIFAARAMKTAIMQHPANIIGHVDGLAASAATFFLTGCDEVEIVDGGFMMIHNAQSFMDVFGYFNLKDLSELRDEIDGEIELHAKLNDSIANDYAKYSGGDKANFAKMMADETWFTADEALAVGIVDRVYDGKPVEGSYDFSIFAKVPESLSERNKNESKRVIEKALRDAGCSNKEAKTILSKGFNNDEHSNKEGQRDVDASEQRDVVDAKDKEVKTIICQFCGKPVDYEDFLIDAAVSINCPECGKEIDHNGKVINKQKPKDKVAHLLARAEIIAPSC